MIKNISNLNYSYLKNIPVAKTPKSNKVSFGGKVTKELANKIKNGEKVLLMFDYDGTLTPIVENPMDAKIDPVVREHLNKISKLKNVKVAIVSGRNIDAIKELTNINNPNIEMYGLHGGEVLKNGQKKVNVSPSCRKQITNLKAAVKNLEQLNGIELEDKEYALALHYRKANKDNASYAIKEYQKQVEKLNLKEDFRYQNGDMVVEVLPKSFNKGNAVNSLINKNENYLPVFFGDDETDKFGFKPAEDNGGYSILVGDRVNYNASDKLSVDKVADFLQSALGPKSVY